MEAVAIGRTFALGAMNVVGSMTSCFVATGSFTRSAENHMAGCQTAASNIVMSAVVFLTLKFLTPLIHYTPNAILAPIIVSTVIGLVDYKATVKIWKVDKFDFVICLGTFLGVVFISVQIGLLIGVLASVVKLLLQVTRPRTAILGRIPTTSAYRNVKQYPEATKIPGIVIFRVDSAIYFSNSNNIKERILRWLTEEEEQLKRTHETRVQYLIIDMSPVTDIDTSGICVFEELYRCLFNRDVKLILANPGRLVLEKLYAAGFPDLIGDNKIF